MNLFHQLDLARPPGFIEEGLQRTVETQNGEPAFLGVRLDPIPFSYISRSFWTEVDSRGAVGVRRGCRRWVTLAAGTWEPLRRLQHRAGLVVIDGERPEPGRRDVLWQDKFVGFGAVEKLAVPVYIGNEILRADSRKAHAHRRRDSSSGIEK